MITGMTVFFQGKPKEKMELMFRVYDQNQDGYIDMNELQIAIQVDSPSQTQIFTFNAFKTRINK